MKVAAFQMSASIASDDRLDRIRSAAHEAVQNGADMLVAPELALTGYGRGDALKDLAQPRNGPWIEQLQAMATEFGINLVVGFPERDGDTCYISAAVIDHVNCENPHFYRKGQLYGDYEKALFCSGGPSTVLVDMLGLKLGFLICYDIEFPEHMRRLAVAGADAVIVPTALPKSASAAFVANHVVRVRAFENQVFVVYADHSDADEAFEYQGLSSISAPDGESLATATLHGDALIYARLDPTDYVQTRLKNPYLEDLLTRPSR